MANLDNCPGVKEAPQKLQEQLSKRAAEAWPAQRCVLLSLEGHDGPEVFQQMHDTVPTDGNHGLQEMPPSFEGQVPDRARTHPMVHHTSVKCGEHEVLEVTMVSNCQESHIDPHQKPVAKAFYSLMVEGSADIAAMQEKPQPVCVQREDHLTLNPRLQSHVRDESLAIRPNWDTIFFVVSLVAMMEKRDTLKRYFRVWLASLGVFPQYKIVFTHVDVLVAKKYPAQTSLLRKLRANTSLHRLWTSGELKHSFSIVADALDTAAEFFGRPKCFAACTEPLASGDDSLGDGMSTPIYDAADLFYFLFRGLRPGVTQPRPRASRTQSSRSPNGTSSQQDPGCPKSSDGGAAGSSSNCRGQHNSETDVQLVPEGY
eukprot:TRINITY_DN2339_c0_g1_i2.p1 TRINITY_DN2339_c0_g1~~TRINITY_DN2339_c0_g1_i2.p1  ORF type:complete len:419 (-),score=5.81 TRINITY_DN2339_c0_g1_i2:409-1521(-)